MNGPGIGRSGKIARCGRRVHSAPPPAFPSGPGRKRLGSMRTEVEEIRALASPGTRGVPQASAAAGKIKPDQKHPAPKSVEFTLSVRIQSEVPVRRSHLNSREERGGVPVKGAPSAVHAREPCGIELRISFPALLQAQPDD